MLFVNLRPPKLSRNRLVPVKNFRLASKMRICSGANTAGSPKLEITTDACTAFLTPVDAVQFAQYSCVGSVYESV